MWIVGIVAMAEIVRDTWRLCHPHVTHISQQSPAYFYLFLIFYITKQEYLFHLAFNFSWIGNKWTTGILWFDIVPTVFCSIAYKIPNRIFLAMTKPLHEQKSRAMLLPVIRQTIIRTMGLKKCNNEPLHDEKRPRKTEVFVQLFIFKWWPELNFLVLKKIPGRLVFFRTQFYTLTCLM